MNPIYIEAKTLLADKQAVKWLDGCGAKTGSGRLFSKMLNEIVADNYAVSFNGPGFYLEFGNSEFRYYRENNYTLCQTPEQFCQGVARIMGIPEPMFGSDTNVVTKNKAFWDSEQAIIDRAKDNPMQPFVDEFKPIKGMAIEISKVPKHIRIELDKYQIDVDEFAWESSGWMWVFYDSTKNEGLDFCTENAECLEGLTITDSPKVFMEYVAQQTGKEYEPGVASEKEIAEMLEKMSEDCFTPPAYPHKTYRILDSLDGIPLDTRFKLSEWIPPFGPKGLVAFVSKEWFEKGYILSVEETHIFIRYGEGKSASIKITDGEWMRIV